MQIVNRRLRPSLRNYSLVAAVLITDMLICSCSKSNYLEVGKPAKVVENQGIYLRATPNPQGRKIVLIPAGQAVSVLAEGLPEKLYDIKSRWYRVSYGKYEGWMWGGLSQTAGQINYDIQNLIRSPDFRTLAGKYQERQGTTVLEIKCDGVFRKRRIDGGNGWAEYGRIENARFKIKKHIVFIAGTSTDMNFVGDDLEISEFREVDLTEYMKDFELSLKLTCEK